MISKYLDKQVILYIVLLGIISVFFIHSSNTTFSQYSGAFIIKQCLFYSIGFIIMFAIAWLDSEQLKKIAWIFYVLILLLLIALIFAPESIAKPINDAKAWYQIPFIGTFQPSEFMKFAFVLVLAKTITGHREKLINNSLSSDSLLLLKIAIITVPPMLIVYKQPDTGMIMLYLALIIPMIYFSTISRKILIGLAAIPLTVVLAFIVIFTQYNDFYNEQLLSKLDDHQISRINGWLSPYEFEDSSYQGRQGMLAIGSGELTGKGYLQNDVYVPEKHTDYIFSTIAEETGFIGASIVIILFFLLLFRLVVIIISTKNHFAYVIGAGIIGLLTFQIFQNIGMTLGLMPITGVTLPFVSYGGSSLLSNFMLIGVILSFKKTYEGYFF
ncbi:FtsW/RodA/SpoVE family cell cycle protein [Lysinibacillus sp. 54212]|uniref:FtsW/RodA/SpoVE family cell cycle protein n=1 Tax=Lysinibacillus sp. 54212 TaxID=3119829 RepID=UPI002FC72988